MREKGRERVRVSERESEREWERKRQWQSKQEREWENENENENENARDRESSPASSMKWVVSTMTLPSLCWRITFQVNLRLYGSIPRWASKSAFRDVLILMDVLISLWMYFDILMDVLRRVFVGAKLGLKSTGLVEAGSTRCRFVQEDHSTSSDEGNTDWQLPLLTAWKLFRIRLSLLCKSDRLETNSGV